MRMQQRPPAVALILWLVGGMISSGRPDGTGIGVAISILVPNLSVDALSVAGSSYYGAAAGALRRREVLRPRRCCGRGRPLSSSSSSSSSLSVTSCQYSPAGEPERPERRQVDRPDGGTTQMKVMGGGDNSMVEMAQISASATAAVIHRRSFLANSIPAGVKPTSIATTVVASILLGGGTAAWAGTAGPAGAAGADDDVTAAVTASDISTSAAAEAKEEIAFRTGAFGREEYTNSIVASRDTNISPKEVYDSIQSQYIRYPLEKLREQQQQQHDAANVQRTKRAPRALDVGAGAGVSTQVLWDMGYREIDAVDWSGKAWTQYVADDPSATCPNTVRFYELDDERYLDTWRSQGSNKFDTIVFNFGINENKAVQFAREMLESENGRLLAPVNVQNDYWLKQIYKVYDSNGDVVKVLGQDIGAWAVQFQPDVTQPTCQGIWCAQFNGFQRKR